MKPLRLWPHQDEAATSTMKLLHDQARAHLVSACGTGKTVMYAEIARRSQVSRQLVAVPTLELAGQLLSEWRDHLGDDALGVITGVCSKEQVVRYHGDLDAEVTTNPDILAARASGPRCTVISTYDSLPVVAAAHDRGMPAFDLAVADEAHRTTGPRAGLWTSIHGDSTILASKRIYGTATPRIGGSVDAISMDDETVFGPRSFTLSFGEAIGRGLLAEYRIAASVVTDRRFRELITDDQMRDNKLQIGELLIPVETVAAQIALLRAAAKWDLRSIITFHTSLAAARRFAVSLPEVARLLPPAERPQRPIDATFVDGKHDPDVRADRIKRLSAPGDALSVVANVRVLVEGVNIPAADGVMFVRPTRSVVLAAQAVGRALRLDRSRPDKIATIIVPIHLTTPRSDVDLANEGWEAVGEVASALAAHDERLAAEFLNERRRLGADQLQTGDEAAQRERPSRKPGWLELVGDPPPEGFGEAIRVHAIRATTTSWDEFYGAAAAYKQQNGNIQIPYGYRTASGLPLGHWLSAQFSNRWPHLTDEQRHLLTELGPYHNIYERNWRKGMTAVHAWLADHPEGLHRIPREWTHDGVKLWNFIMDRQMDRRARRLSPEHDAELCAADPAWYLTRPQVFIRACRAFYREHGHLLPDPDYRTPNGLDLYAWLYDARNRYSAKKLSREVYNALRRLGMIWSRLDAQLMRGIIAARAHHRVHGTLVVPADHVCSDGYELGGFLKHQNYSRRQGTIRPWCDDALTAIDPDWYTIRTKTERRARRLALAYDYAKQHGHLPISRAGCPPPDGEDFRPWLAEQRLNARKGTINRDVANGLTAIDPNWCPDPSDVHPLTCPNPRDTPA